MKVAQRSVALEIPAGELAKVEALCVGPAVGCGRDELVYEKEVDFGEGFRMLLQAIAPSEPESYGCWTQGVLFELRDGLLHEVGCTDAGDTFSGEYTVEHDGCEYTARVSCARER